MLKVSRIPRTKVSQWEIPRRAEAILSYSAPLCLYLHQGKSRSSVAAVAYVMTCYDGKGVQFEEGLRIVQEHRKMAEPNHTFMKLLEAFGKSTALKDTRELLNK